MIAFARFFFLWVIGNSPSTDDGIVGVDVQIQYGRKVEIEPCAVSSSDDAYLVSHGNGNLSI